MDPTIRKILGLNEHDEDEGGEEKEDGKLRQEVVIYLTPEQIGNDEGAHCGACFFFHKPTSECFLTSPAKCNAEHGVCDFFLGGGKNLFTEKSKPTPQELIPKEAAGYTQQGPTRCGLCEYWQGEEHAKGNATSTCAKVKGTIAASACCNNWEEC